MLFKISQRFIAVNLKTNFSVSKLFSGKLHVIRTFQVGDTTNFVNNLSSLSRNTASKDYLKDLNKIFDLCLTPLGNKHVLRFAFLEKERQREKELLKTVKHG